MSRAENEHVEDILDELVDDAKIWYGIYRGSGGSSAANLTGASVFLVAELMKKVELHGRLTGPEKKALVGAAVLRFAEEVPGLDQGVTQQALAELVPVLIDGLASAANGQLFAKAKSGARSCARGFRSLFACCCRGRGRAPEASPGPSRSARSQTRTDRQISISRASSGSFLAPHTGQRPHSAPESPRVFRRSPFRQSPGSPSPGIMDVPSPAARKGLRRADVQVLAAPRPAGAETDAADGGADKPAGTTPVGASSGAYNALPEPQQSTI